MLPIILLGGAALAAVTGLKKGYDAWKKNGEIDKLLKALKEGDEKTKKDLLEAKNKVEVVAEETKIIMKEVYGEKIPYLYDLISSIKNIEGSIESKDLKANVELDLGKVKIELADLKSIVLTTGTTLVSGVAAGVASNIGITSLVMSIGTASTGTAISSLSGAAATNAFLAFLGGGSLAAGGGGIALGSIVLGGVTIAPAILIGGFVMDKIMEGKLEDVKQELVKAEQVFLAREEGTKLYTKLAYLIELYSNLITTFRQIVDKEIHRVKSIIEKYGHDAYNYDKETVEGIRKAFKVLSIGVQLGKIEILKEDQSINEEFEVKLENCRLMLENV